MTEHRSTQGRRSTTRRKTGEAPKRTRRPSPPTTDAPPTLGTLPPSTVAGHLALTPDRDPRPADELTIQRAAPIPYYAQLAEIIRRHIAEGTWPAGEAVPSENELCETYGLSRTVVRQALDELVAEGLVVKEKGRGTFVSQPKMADLVIQELRGFHDEMSARGHDVGTMVLAQKTIPAPPLIAPYLGIASHDKVVYVSRIRSIDGEPVMKVDTWLPAERFGDLEGADLETQSMYAVLQTDFGVSPVGGWRRVEAAVASREMADLLGVEIGSPMLHMTAVSADAEGRPFEFFTSFYRGDRTSFELLLTRATPT